MANDRITCGDSAPILRNVSVIVGVKCHVISCSSMVFHSVVFTGYPVALLRCDQLEKFKSQTANRPSSAVRSKSTSG